MNDVRFRRALTAFQSNDLACARREAEALLRDQPDDAAGEHLLGLIFCREGSITQGLVHLRRACEQDPSNQAFRLMLARALVDSGRGPEALAMVPPPTGAAGNHPALWQVRAEAADAAGDWTASADAWQRVGTLQPHDWRACSNAGNALAKLGRWGEAADCLHRAVQLNPVEQPLRRNLVSALGQSGRMQEARREVEQLLAADPDDGAARMLYAKALSELGEYQQSLDQYDRAVADAIARNPGRPGDGLVELGRRSMSAAGADEPPFDILLLRSVAALLDRTNRIDALRDFLRAAADAGLPDDEFANSRAALALRDGEPVAARAFMLAKGAEGDAVYHYRLLAKIEEKLGDPAAAFAAAVKMNRAVDDHAGWRDRGERYRATVRQLRANAVQSIGRIRPLTPGRRRSPAFLVGFPRSGTTLLDTFLMGHPRTAVMEEVHLIGAAEDRLGGTTRLDLRSAVELETARAAYFEELDRHLDPAFDGLVIDKMPLNMLALPFIFAMFPDAKIIFAQRHPCDCVLSCFMQSFVLNDAMANFLELDDAADFYDAVLDQFSFARDHLPLAVQTLVYERLIADPAAALRPLIDFLGLEWDEALLDHRATAAKRGAIITPSYDQVVKPLDSAPSGRWLRYREQMDAVLPILRPWAERLGYTANGQISQ